MGVVGALVSVLDFEASRGHGTGGGYGKYGAGAGPAWQGRTSTRANEFAATTTRSRPARTAGPRWISTFVHGPGCTPLPLHEPRAQASGGGARSGFATHAGYPPAPCIHSRTHALTHSRTSQFFRAISLALRTPRSHVHP